MSEHDDVPTITSEELNLDTFLSPGIQMFVLNNTTLLSLVEIPLLDQPDALLTTAASQVRVIMRDISGKFSWDASLLYSGDGLVQPPERQPSWQGVSVQQPGGTR